MYIPVSVGPCTQHVIVSLPSRRRRADPVHAPDEGSDSKRKKKTDGERPTDSEVSSHCFRFVESDL